MTFLEYRDFLEDNQDFYLYKAVVASEVDCFAEEYELKLSNDDFTRVCEFVYDWILDTEASAVEVAREICWGLREKEISIADMDDYSEEDNYLSKAEKWLNDRF